MARIFRSATGIIAALTALAFLVAWTMGQNDYAAAALGFIPARVGGAHTPWISAPTFLTPLTATFVHGNLLHLATNLLVFVWCGNAVEKALGRGNLVIIYVIGAYAAAAAQWLSDPHSIVPMVGASGAISAVMAAFALSFGRPRMFTRNIKVNRWLHIAHLLVAWIVIQMLVAWIAGAQGLILATPAHIGGFIAGLLLQRPLLLWKFRNA
jgi:membrane associated rhomboid family serine protease